MYRVDVVSNDSWLNAFENFSNKCWFGSSIQNIDDALEPWHCKNIANTPYIEFRSENDAMLFLLRWS